MIQAVPKETEALYGLSEIERESPWSCFIKDICFTAGVFDESLVCLRTLERLSKPLPSFFPASVKKRQAEYLAGRLCAGDAINRLQGRWLTPGTGARGAPLWPQGVVGSISHNGWYVVSVVMRKEYASGAGIDVEAVIPAAQIEVVAKNILKPVEKQRFLAAGQSIWEKQVNLTLVFSLKESLFKALYPIIGKPFYFESAEVLSCATDQVARLRIVDDLSPRLRSGLEFNGYTRLYRGKVLTMIVVKT